MEKSLSVLHTADWHMDDNNHDEVLKMLEVIISEAIFSKPDLIVIAGDITHSQNTKLDSKSARSLINVITKLSEIAPVIIVIGTPSHDGMCAEILNQVPYKGFVGRTVQVSTKPEFFHIVDGEILTKEQVVVMDNPKTTFVVSTLPTPTKQFFPQNDLSIEGSDKAISVALNGLFAGFGAMAAEYPKAPHIHVGHYQTKGASISDTQVLVGVDIEISKDQLSLMNADIVALGHIHKEQEYYSGSITHNTFGELDPKGYKMHEFEGEKLPDFDGEKLHQSFQKKTTFCKLPARNLYLIEKDFIERPVDEDEIRKELNDLDLKGCWLKIVIQIWHDEVRQINQVALEQYFHLSGCDKVIIDLIRKPREAVRSEKVLEAETLPEKIIEAGKIKNEEIPVSLCIKATKLETMNPEDLYKTINEENQI